VVELPEPPDPLEVVPLRGVVWLVLEPLRLLFARLPPGFFMLPPSVALEPGILSPIELREASGFDPDPELPDAANEAADPRVKAAVVAVMINRLMKRFS
jgi:hypothetical protein